MRNLTIKRTKSFVGCLGKIKIYIEDPASSELLINSIPCRKLGDLKNGEEKTFQIPNEAARVFVIADKLSRNISNEYYQLPEGEDDISLSGKNKYNPTTGNAFRFDNNESEGAVKNRKKNIKRGIWVLIAAVIIGIAIGLLNVFVLDAPKEKDFSAQGMTITLTDEFRKFNDDEYTAVYDSAKVAVFVSKVDATKEDSLAEFAEMLAVYCDLSPDSVKTADGLTYITYNNINSQNNVTYRYTAYLYQTDDAFWVVEFATDKKDADDYAKKITEWAKSVRFAE